MRGRGSSERLGEVPVRPWGRERGAGSLTSFGKRPLEFLSAEDFILDHKKLFDKTIILRGKK